MMYAVASQGHKSDPMNFQLLTDSIPALIPTTPPDGNLDFFNQIWLGYVGISLGFYKVGNGRSRFALKRSQEVEAFDWYIPALLKLLTSQSNEHSQWSMNGPIDSGAQPRNAC